MNNSCKQEFETIVQYLKDSTSRNRKSTRDYLQLLEEPRFFDCLVDALNDTDSWIRNLAAGSLAKLNYNEAYLVLIDLAENYSNSSAVQTLGILKYKLALEPLVSILIDKSRQVWLRIEAGKALGEIGDEQAVEPLSRVYLDESDSDYYYEKDITVRASAAQSLSRFGKKTLPLFTSSLKSQNTLTRYYAAKALGIIGDKETVAILIQTVKDKEYSVQRAAIKSLGQINDNRAADTIFNVLIVEPGLMKIEASIALGKLGDLRAVEPLIEILQNPKLSQYDRAEAASLLGQLQDARALDPLMEALKVELGLIRARAAEALASFGDKKAILLLEWVIQNSSGITGYNEEAQKVIVKALEQLQRA